MEWRLAGNGSKTKDSHGRVDVKINGTWGSICNFHFSRADANVVCRHLGYASGDPIDNRYVLLQKRLGESASYRARE